MNRSTPQDARAKQSLEVRYHLAGLISFAASMEFLAGNERVANDLMKLRARFRLYGA